MPPATPPSTPSPPLSAPVSGVMPDGASTGAAGVTPGAGAGAAAGGRGAAGFGADDSTGLDAAGDRDSATGTIDIKAGITSDGLASTNRVRTGRVSRNAISAIAQMTCTVIEVPYPARM